MAKITLTVLADTQKAEGQIKTFRSNVDNAFKNPVKIRVDAEGIDALSKETLKALQSQAKIAEANAKITTSENKLKIAREQTKQATEKRMTAESNLATQIERTATAEENARAANTRLQQQIEKTNTAEAQATLQAEKTATAAENRARAEANATTATQRLGEATKETAKTSESLFDNLQKFARWWLVGGIITGITNDIRDALNALKEVDSELVTIRKVTGFSDSQISGVQQQAFSTASAYGVRAADYLNSVAQFARAGYKEQSAALAELSTKTQIVGDTTAEVANQFLLSVDAAYQYKGSVEELTKVLDGANELDNKYATSIEKIAEGMGIVAPVAKQVNVGVDELAAAIGTITAVTQRSGSEAARALRALFLNIVGDTKTEIDEGVTWTTGEIAGLQDVIKLYAKDAYDAAQATGEVLNPMEAIAGLAKSMEDGVLTAAKLTEMVSDIGGKLRTSQLLAIIQNWDMYTSMVEDFNGAVGSADKEVENALDSWERKTAQMQNAWTKFISHLVNTKEVKGAIDVITGAINLLDSEIGRGIVQAGLLVAAFGVANHMMKGQLVSSLQLVIDHFLGLQTAELAAAEASGTLSAAMNTVAIFAVVAAVVALVTVFDELNVSASEHAEAMREANQEYEDAMNKVGDLNTKLEENIRLLLEANEAGKDNSYLQRLFKENEQLREQIELEMIRARNAKKREADEALKAATTRDYFSVGQSSLSVLQMVSGGVKFGVENMDEGGKAYTMLSEAVDKLIEYRDAIQGAKDAGVELTDEQNKFLVTANQLISTYTRQLGASEDIKGATEDIIKRQQTLTSVSVALSKALESGISDYDELDKKVTPLANAYKELAENGEISAATLRTLAEVYPELNSSTAVTVETLEKYIDEILTANGYSTDFSSTVKSDVTHTIKSLNIELLDQVTIYNQLKAALDPLTAAMNELNTSGYMSEKTMKALLEAYPELQGAIQVTTNGFVIEKQAVQDLINAQLSEYQVIYNNAKNAATNLLEAEGIKVGALNGTTEAIKNQLKALQALYFVQATEAMAKGEDPSQYSNAAEQAAAAWKDLDAAERNYQTASDIMPVFLPSSVGTGSSGGSGTSGGTSKDEYLEDLKDAVALEKQRLSFLEGSGAAQEEQVEQIQKVQEALHKQADYLRSIGASEKDVLALSTEWWSYQSKIEKLAEDTAKAAAEAAKTLREEAAAELERIGELLDKQAEAITSPLQAELDALKEAHEIREDDTEEAEKLLAVEKARIALENAQNERTVRVYNAATGQWEWQANAATVKSARETLAGAEKDLADFYENQRYAKAVAELENRIKGTNDAFKSLEDTLKDLASGVKTGSVSEADAYTALRGSINELGLGGSLLDVMKANSAAWHGADAERQKELAAENLAIGTALGLHIGKNGVWYDAEGNEAYGSGAGLALAGSALAGGDILKSADWENHLRRLGIVTAGGGAVSGYAGGVSTTSIGSQHNGNVYQLGGVTLTEQQARGLTVYDLMTLSGALALGG